MCGIAGIVDLTSARPPRANHELAQAMADAIHHRGPDGGGVWHSPAGVWLSHRRLAIVDVSAAGAQPMQTPDGRTTISYNGEIYNASDLRPELEAAGYRFRGHSDTEVLLYACDLWGPARAAERAFGMFAFACWDESSRTLTLVRDRLGKKPVYWFHDRDTFAFASELRPLLLHPDCPTDIDRSSVAEYLRFAYVPAPASIFTGVSKLEPGRFLSLHVPSGRTEGGTYWDLAKAADRAIAAPFTGCPRDAVAETERLLLDATRIRMVSDVPLGAFLSGGVDSSLVTALMQEAGSGVTRTFSISSPDVEYDEGAEAAAVAAHLGTDHTSFVVQPGDAMDAIMAMPRVFDEPFADSSQVPTYLVSKLARQEVTVALTGDGGDEVFAGYNRHVAAAGLIARANRLPRPVRSALSSAIRGLSPGQWQSLFKAVPKSARPRLVGDKLHKFARLLPLDEREQYLSLTSQWDSPEQLLGGSVDRASWMGTTELRSDIADPVARMRYFDLATYLPGDILTKVDRASMAASLETRAPLLDHRLVEWSFRVPTAIHLNDGKGKWILRQLLEKRIPPAMVNRPKSGFDLPIGEWLRGPLRGWAESLLGEERLNSVGITRTDLVRAVWARHLRREVNAQDLIWPILMLAEWHGSIFGQAARPPAPPLAAAG